MRLQLLTIGPWEPPGALMGNLFFDTDEEPGSMAEYVAVRSVPEPPGYVFVDDRGEPMTDLTNPMLREADRIMRVLLLPAEETARRARDWQAVLHSGRLEGYPNDPAWETQLFRYARGEISADDVIAWADGSADGEARNGAESGSPPMDVPAGWWAAMQLRFQAWWLGHSVDDVDAAGMLDCTTPDITNLLLSGRLVEAEVAGRQRIPRWQFLDPDPADQDKRWGLLPGLDILIAATPPGWNPGTDMSAFMTTPHAELIRDDQPVSPAEWLAAGSPLVPVIAALTSARRARDGRSRR